jgi:hypothetical protein
MQIPIPQFLLESVVKLAPFLVPDSSLGLNLGHDCFQIFVFIVIVTKFHRR